MSSLKTKDLMKTRRIYKCNYCKEEFVEPRRLNVGSLWVDPGPWFNECPECGI